MNPLSTEDRASSTAAACLVIALAGVAAYSNSLNVPFLFDDLPSIVNNPTIRSLSNIGQVLSPPGGGETVGGRPILNLSFALNYAVSGERLWSWHALNIAIHVLAGLCLFGIARQTFVLCGVSEQYGEQPRYVILPALAIALLWTVHPLTTESVTYIVQRAESLVGLWLLLTLYCSIRAAHNRESGRRISVWHIAAVVACLLGMATKEVMVVAPVLVVICDWALRRNTLAGTLWTRRWFYASLASTWILLGALQFGSTSRGGSAGFGQGVGSWDYLRTQFGFIALYLKLCFWPSPLVLDYGDQVARPSAPFLPQAALVVSLAVATLAALCSRRYRPLGFLGACFFCILAPSSSVVPVITQTGAEHRMYLPLAAIVALVVVAAGWLWDRVSANWRPLWQIIPPSAAVFVAALALASLSVSRNKDYATVASIWSDTSRKCPENWRAHYSLGCYHYFAGELEQALESFDRSIALNSNEFSPLQYHGFTCLKLNRFKDAQADFLRCLALNARDAATHYNLALARAGADELEPALESATDAVRLSPANARFRRTRGSLLARLGRHAEALQEYSEVVYLDPQSIPAYRSRAVAYINLKRYDRARADLAEMQRLGAKPDPELLKRLRVEQPEP